MKLTVFKVTGETNTDDLSPAPDAWSRPDIPLHALAMYKMTRDGLTPEKHGEVGPLAQIEEIKAKGHKVAFVGDVVGTGSSRKSATNSVLWFFGEDIPGTGQTFRLIARGPEAGPHRCAGALRVNIFYFQSLHLLFL